MADPKIVSRFSDLLRPYTSDNVQLPFYELSTKQDMDGISGLHLVEFRVSGETAIAFHFDLVQSTFRVVDVGPRQETHPDELAAVFGRAQAFLEAARAEGFQEGEVRH